MAAPCPTPQPGGPAYLSLCGTLFETCPACVALPVAVLPAYLISVKVNYSVNIVEDNLETLRWNVLSVRDGQLPLPSVLNFVTTSHLAITWV